MNVEALLELEEQYKEYAALCKCGMRTVLARIENLHEEMELSDERNFYDTIESRIKNFESVVEKLERKGYEQNISSIKANMHDVAGIRIVTLFKDDIYKIYDAIYDTLQKQPTMEVIEKRDYIESPKKTGYRSLHLRVSTRINFREGEVFVPVEIQIRTKAMDLWASLEHYCRYKNDNPSEKAPETFDRIAKILDEFDNEAIELRDRKD